MQWRRVILFSVLLAGPTYAQTTYKLQAFHLIDEKEKPANAVKYSTKPTVSVYASGHWMWVDRKDEEDAIGFSVSNLTCDKPGLYRKEGGCSEESATVLPLFGFQVQPDHTEYDIISWRTDGLTARFIGGACRISYTIDIDFKTGNVLRTQAPTKPPDKQCNLVTKASQEQLMEGTAFQLVPGKEQKKSQ